MYKSIKGVYIIWHNTINIYPKFNEQPSYSTSISKYIAPLSQNFFTMYIHLSMLIHLIPPKMLRHPIHILLYRNAVLLINKFSFINAIWEGHRPVIYTQQIPCRFYSRIGCSISRGLDGHGHFWTKLISFRRRVLYKNIQISELKYLEFYFIK